MKDTVTYPLSAIIDECNHDLWVVEVLHDGCWYPTTGYGFNREDGRKALKIWRNNESRNKYRLVRMPVSNDWIRF